MVSLILSYLSPFPSSSSSSSSSNSNKKNRNNRDRKNPRLVDANDPVLMMSPRVGCMGQIKTRKPCSHDVRKRKQKESSNILVRCLAPLFKGSSKVRDVPMSVKMVVSIREMDPPLPVKMKKHEDDLYKLSLWERRSAGAKELEKLELTERRRQLTTIAEICLFS